MKKNVLLIGFVLLLNTACQNTIPYNSVSGITDQRVKQVGQLLNDRPERKFKYRTPNQVLKKKMHLLL